MVIWHVYLVRCARGSLYTGIATDVARRFEEHRSGGPRAARYLRGRQPLRLEFQCAIGARSDAARAEIALKRLAKAQKEDLVAGRMLITDVLPAVRTVRKSSPDYSGSSQST